MSDRDQFTDHLLESSKDPIFIEFLQQLFPWVICNPFGPSPGKRCAGIEWAINEISQFLYSVKNYSEGSVRLVRSSSDRPRGSFGNLLHGQNTTVRLKGKLQYFILEAFHFARPDTLIVHLEWRQVDTSSHTDGVFIGCLVLWHTNSHTKPAALSEKSGDTETIVHLRLDSPDNQGHLPGIDRDVDIFIKVERGEDVPALYSSQGSSCESSSKSESMGTLTSDSGSNASGDQLVRLNAMSEPAKFAAASDRASSCDSDSTLRYDPSQDDGSDLLKDVQSVATAMHNPLVAPRVKANIQLRSQDGEVVSIDDKTLGVKAAEMPINPHTGSSDATLGFKPILHWACNVENPDTHSMGAHLQVARLQASVAFKGTHSMGTRHCVFHRQHNSLARQELAEVILVLIFYFHYHSILFTDYNIHAGHVNEHGYQRFTTSGFWAQSFPR